MKHPSGVVGGQKERIKKIDGKMVKREKRPPHVWKWSAAVKWGFCLEKGVSEGTRREEVFEKRGEKRKILI